MLAIRNREMKNSFLYFIILANIFLNHTTLIGITLSNKSDREIDVEILKIETSRIYIQLVNGTKTWVDRNDLSDASQELINELAQKELSTFETINTLLGIALLKDNSLWDDTIDTVAKRLEWPQESETQIHSSYRKYPKENYKILTTRPYSCALYGLDRRPTRLSIIFANKGDFEFDNLSSREQIKAINSAIQKDKKILSNLLREAFGKPKRQSFGTGRDLKERVLRWDWRDHAFLLVSKDDEYVGIRVINTKNADNKGRNERFSDAALRKIAKANITKRANGDIIINNIPMVNQGPKGYCVPATFERYMRYMQIPADMYILAMAGQTGIGGGTSQKAMRQSVESYLASQSRRIKDINKSISIKNVQKYIDQGLPIIWWMYSTNAYNQYANARTNKRLEVTDWDDWEKKTLSEARDLDLIKDYSTAHACLITGYNKSTNEIAVSDSWGLRFNERWVAAEKADQVSLGSISIIDF